MKTPVKTTIYHYQAWLAYQDPAQVTPILEQMLQNAGYRIVGFTEHHFSPQGYTCLWLLAESHLALHTFPEEGRSYLELSGCSLPCNRSFTRELRKIKDLRILQENQEGI